MFHGYVYLYLQWSGSSLIFSFVCWCLACSWLSRVPSVTMWRFSLTVSRVPMAGWPSVRRGATASGSPYCNVNSPVCRMLTEGSKLVSPSSKNTVRHGNQCLCSKTCVIITKKWCYVSFFLIIENYMYKGKDISLR